VDPKACKKKMTRSLVFGADHEVYFSYHACQSVDTFEDELLGRQLVGRTLRVGVPSWNKQELTLERDWPWLFLDENYDVAGIPLDFLRSVASDLGFKIELTQVSDHAMIQTKDEDGDRTQVACSHDVATGKLDICIGSFWETTEQRELALFSPSLGSDLMYLIVKAQPGKSFFGMFMKIFAPLSAGLWLTLVVSLLLGSLFLVIMGDIDSSKEGIVAGVFAVGKKACGHGTMRVSRPGSWVLMGVEVLFAYTVLSYTASLSSMLVLEGAVGSVSNLEEALAAKYKICVDDDAEKALVGINPRLKDALIPTEFKKDMAAKMDKGECDAMILDHDFYLNMRAGVAPYNEPHCNKIEVGEVIMPFNLGLPISKELSRPLGYLLTRAIYTGQLENDKARYPDPESTCPKAGIRSEFTPLFLSDVSALLLVTVTCMVGGLVYHYVEDAEVAVS
jgi:hypothetical protein